MSSLRETWNAWLENGTCIKIGSVLGAVSYLGANIAIALALFSIFAPEGVTPGRGTAPVPPPSPG